MPVLPAQNPEAAKVKNPLLFMPIYVSALKKLMSSFYASILGFELAKIKNSFRKLKLTLGDD